MYKYTKILKQKTHKNRKKFFLVKKKKMFLKNTIFFKNVLFLENKNFKRKFFKFKKKFFKKKYKIQLYFIFNINISKKSKNTRMGKGKGKIKNIMFKINKLNFFLKTNIPKSKKYKTYRLFFDKKKLLL